MAKKWLGNRKRRTREHVIAEMSVNFLERKVLQRGHQLFRMGQVEYGIDAIMYHFGQEGGLENGHVQFQLKATDHLKFNRDREYLPVVVDEGHLDHWSKELHPFILVLFDARNMRGYWLYVQEYVRSTGIYPKGDTVTLLVPVKNKLTVYAVDRFAEFSRSIMQMDGKG